MLLLPLSEPASAEGTFCIEGRCRKAPFGGGPETRQAPSAAAPPAASDPGSVPAPTVAQAIEALNASGRFLSHQSSIALEVSNRLFASSESLGVYKFDRLNQELQYRSGSLRSDLQSRALEFSKLAEDLSVASRELFDEGVRLAQSRRGTPASGDRVRRTASYVRAIAEEFARLANVYRREGADAETVRALGSMASNLKEASRILYNYSSQIPYAR